MYLFLCGQIFITAISVYTDTITYSTVQYIAFIFKVLYLMMRNKNYLTRLVQEFICTVRVLARVSKLAVQKDFVGLAQYFPERGRTKTCVLGRCRNFFVMEL